MCSSLKHLEAAPDSRGVPSPRRPVPWVARGDAHHVHALEAAALAAFIAAIARALAPVTQDERMSVARAHEALAAGEAPPGRDAHKLAVGDEFTFDAVDDCMRSLKRLRAAGCEGIPAKLQVCGWYGC